MKALGESCLYKGPRTPLSAEPDRGDLQWAHPQSSRFFQKGAVTSSGSLSSGLELANTLPSPQLLAILDTQPIVTRWGSQAESPWGRQEAFN